MHRPRPFPLFPAISAAPNRTCSWEIKQMLRAGSGNTWPHRNHFQGAAKRFAIPALR